MIESITLENWKTHKASTLHFRKGTNVLVGVIGSGKSSVMDGLCYGLFGTFPALSSHRVNVSDLLMRKPYSADQGRVEVSFSVGEKKYRVERILKRDGINEGRLWCNDSLIAGPKPNQVTERVEKELNVTYELFTRAVYSEQNQVDYFLKLNPGERKKKIDELLELQKYEGVRANAMQIVNQFRKQEEMHAQSLSQFDAVLQNQDLNEVRVSIAMQQQKISALVSQKAAHASVLAELHSRVRELEQTVHHARKAQDALSRMEAQRDSLKTRMHSLSSSAAGMVDQPASELEAEKTRLSAQWSKVASQQAQFRAAEALVQKTAERVRGLEARLNDLGLKLGSHSPASLEQSIRETELALSVSREHWAQVQRDIAASTASIEVAKQKLLSLAGEEQSILSLHASCPTCQQTISADHRTAIQAQLHQTKINVHSEMVAAQDSYMHHHSRLAEADSQYRKLEAGLRDQTLLREKVKEHALVESECAVAKAAAIQAHAALTNLGPSLSAEELGQMQARLALLEKGIEYHSLVHEFARLEGSIAPLRSELALYVGSQDQLVSAMRTFSDAQSAAANVDKDLGMESKLLVEFSARAQQIEKIQSQREEIHAKRVRALDVQQSMGVFSHVLVETQQQLREAVVEAINVALLELWPWVYPYKDFTLAKLLVQDHDYVLTVQERNGNWISAESSLSGGERSAAALALRMAIAFVLTRQLSWMILDEPTHNLDAKSVATLAEVLRVRLPELVDQVFVITHSAEIEKAATGSLYVLQREKNEDGVTFPVNKMDLAAKLQ